jgi:hypothetical protein
MGHPVERNANGCGGARILHAKEYWQRVQFFHFGDDRSSILQEDFHVEHTHQMRSYGVYVYGSSGQEVLLYPLRGCKRYDYPDLPLRACGVRRQGVTDRANYRPQATAGYRFGGGPGSVISNADAGAPLAFLGRAAGSASGVGGAVGGA